MKLDIKEIIFGSYLKMKTKTAVLYESGKPLVVEELEIPELKEGQVLVKIFYSGICHSQINEIKALKGEDKYLPHTLGHEASGIVEKIGPGINKVKVGDYVVVSWIKGSGKDSYGIHYIKDGKKINAGSAATFSEYAIIAENRLTKISEKIPKQAAVLLGCAILTGGGIIINELNASDGSSLAVFGVGGVGTSAIIVAAATGKFKEIIAVDIYEHKLEFAKQLGATKTINARNKNLIDEIYKLTEGKGVDFAIETAGSKQAMEMAFKAAKAGVEGKNGGSVIIAGNISKDENIEIQPFELIKGKQIRGTWGGRAFSDKDIPIYEKLYLEGKLPLEKLISKVYELKDINKALEDVEQGKIQSRALIKFS